VAAPLRVIGKGPSVRPEESAAAAGAGRWPVPYMHLTA
jgi:hypothetical protein